MSNEREEGMIPEGRFYGVIKSFGDSHHGPSGHVYQPMTVSLEELNRDVIAHLKIGTYDMMGVIIAIRDEWVGRRVRLSVERIKKDDLIYIKVHILNWKP